MRTLSILALAAGLTLAACDDPVGRTTGTLRVSTYTEGGAPNPTGYVLAVDEADSLQLDPTGTAEIDLAAGRHAVRLVGVAEGCSVAPGTSLDIDIARGNTTPVAFEITCPLTGDGTLAVSTSTGGDDPDSDGYLLLVDDVDSLTLRSTGTAEIHLAPGRHTLQLLGVAERCTVAPEAPVEVEVAPLSTTRVAFEVSCLATGVRVLVRTTGLDLDGDGYRLVVDGTDRGPISGNAATLVRLDPGSRALVLTELAPNCSVDGPGSSTVTIVEREVVPIGFTVVCTATSGVIGVAVLGGGAGARFEATVDGVTPFQVLGHAYLTGVPAGRHVVSLEPLANCSVRTDRRSVTVTAGGLVRDTVEVTFSAICEAALRVIAPTTGPIPQSDYSVLRCAYLQGCSPEDGRIPLGHLAPNDTLLLQVDPGRYRFYLGDLPHNCSISRLRNPTPELTIGPGELLTVVFPVACS